MPKVSVILPVYNAEKYLNESLNSVICQTFKDFELLAIDDGSTDNSLTKLSLAAEKDIRIRIIKNEKNLGLVDTLNKGLAAANGQYIVRMDADDICMPMRFERQVSFMDSKTNIGIAGSWVNFFGDSNYTLKLPCKHEYIKARLLFRPPIIHPSTIMRRDIFSKYPLSFKKEYSTIGEDYALWVDALDYIELANIPLALLKFRIAKGSYTDQKRSFNLQIASYNCLKMIHSVVLDKVGINPTEYEYCVHHFVSNGTDFIEKKISMNKVISWLNYIYAKNKKMKTFDTNALSYSLTLSLLSTLKFYNKKQLVSNIPIFRSIKPSWAISGALSVLKQRL